MIYYIDGLYIISRCDYKRKACSLFPGQADCSALSRGNNSPCCMAIITESGLARASHQVLTSSGRTVTTPSREFFPLLNTLGPLSLQMLHRTDKASLCIPFELGLEGSIRAVNHFQHRSTTGYFNCLALEAGWETCYNQLCRGN